MKRLFRKLMEKPKTGVKKYDDLPSRVRWMDVDIRRYMYEKLSKQLKEIKKDLDWAVKKNTK